jgi:4-amino-4-deoxy-L-arabinose transferase-like glycosyltransferase
VLAPDTSLKDDSTGREATSVSLEVRPARSSSIRSLGVILALGAVVRIALWWYWADLPVRIVDAQDYNGLAVRLLEQGAYLDSSGHLTSLRPPLYPVFVASVYRVFGIENCAAVRAIQAVLGLLLTLPVYWLGREAFSERVGVLGAAWFCFYPSMLGFNNLLLSETLFTVLLVTATLTAVLAIRRQSLGMLVLTGVLLGLGALARSILFPFALVLGPYLLFAWRGRLPRRGLAAVTPVLVCAAVLAPWAIRNTRVQETFCVVDVMGGRNAMMGNYEFTPLERSWATISIVQGERAWDRVLAAEHPAFGSMTQGQRDKVALQHAKRYVLAHPGQTMQRDIVRFFNFWQLERTLVAGAKMGFFGATPGWGVLVAAIVICGVYAVTIFAGVLGAFMAAPRDRRLHWLLVLTILFPCVLHTLIFAHSRYHLPVMPLVMLYAASAVMQAPSLWSRVRSPQFALACLACLCLIAGWVREIIVVDLEKFLG